ncbi:MAG: hypothetical protein MI807_04510, partial [Verrucomicrobiales bacterium]|nr:hypothetical protein [Verrucomicrobiales bacterium]
AFFEVEVTADAPGAGQATIANDETNPLTGNVPVPGTSVSNIILVGENAKTVEILPVEGASDLVIDGRNSEDLGNVLIISKDNDPLNPNDDEGGGQLIFDFNDPVIVESVDLLDINELGGTIKLYGANGALLSTTLIPALGENTFQTVFVKQAADNTPVEATRMVIDLNGDGAISEIVYTEVNPVREYSIDHQYINEGDAHCIEVTVQDDDGGTATTSGGKIEVTNGPPIITEQTAIPTTSDRSTVTMVNEFIDSVDDIHTATVNFGDGTEVQVIVLEVDPGDPTRLVVPTYPLPGPSITVTDANGVSVPGIDPTSQEGVSFRNPATGDTMPAIDPITGEPTLMIDPVTGEIVPMTDPATGTPALIVDPATGDLVPATDPATGLPVLVIDPATGALIPNIDPATGNPVAAVSGATTPGAIDAILTVDPNAGQPISFIDPATGALIPLVDPVTGQSNLDQMFDPVTGKLAPILDPVTGEPTTSFAVLDASIRQIVASHQYGVEATFSITTKVTDEEGASDSRTTQFDAFLPKIGTPIHNKPIDIIPTLERAGFDISQLTGGSGLFGQRIPAGVFGGMIFGNDAGIFGTPVLSGITTPGGLVAVTFYDGYGQVLGMEEVNADTNGYWLAMLEYGYILEEGSGIASALVTAPSALTGDVDPITYDFAPDSVVEDTLRHEFEIGDVRLTGRLIAPADEISHEDEEE